LCFAYNTRHLKAELNFRLFHLNSQLKQCLLHHSLESVVWVFFFIFSFRTYPREHVNCIHSIFIHILSLSLCSCMNQAFQSFCLINSITIQWQQWTMAYQPITLALIETMIQVEIYYRRELDIAIYSLTKSWILLNFIILKQLSMTWHINVFEGDIDCA